MIEGTDILDDLMRSLDGALQAEEAVAVDLVVCGGAALNALGLVARATDDIDVLALVVRGEGHEADPFPPGLSAAIERVARDRRLPSNWMNHGPTEMVRFGLPEGLLERTTVVVYGPRLTVRYIDRIDQIHLKLYALVDQGPGKHVGDFRSLAPTRDEVQRAVSWCRQQDPSEGFAIVLRQALDQLGFDDVDVDL